MAAVKRQAAQLRIPSAASSSCLICSAFPLRRSTFRLSPDSLRSLHSTSSAPQSTLNFQLISPKEPIDPSIAPDLPPSKPPRLRFAPSPTGQLHLGGLRTALFNHLFARKFGGQWILRVEDTDQSRLVPGSLESMQEILLWAGLQWDEGPGVSGGSKGPYIQSQRLEIYKHYSEELIKQGKAYRDFRVQKKEDSDLKTAIESVKEGRLNGLTQEQIKKTQKLQKLYLKGVNKAYAPPDEEEAQSLIRAGERYCVRLKTEPVEAQFHDGVRGRLLYKPDLVAEDPILMKTDGWPTYHLANVVDDHLMGITHVLRGEEWLPSVPKHLAIYSAFGFKPPTFLHLPLLMNKDRTKLSKKTKDVHVSEYKDMGYEPEAVLNYVALMGYNHHGEEPPQDSQGNSSAREVFTLERLIETFDPLKISPHRAVPFPPKLDFLNRRHLLIKAAGDSDVPGQTSPSSLHILYQRLLPHLQESIPSPSSSTLFEEPYVSKIIQETIGRVPVVFHDLPHQIRYFFEEPDYDIPPEKTGEPTMKESEKQKKRRKILEGIAHPRFVEFVQRAQQKLIDMDEVKWNDKEALQETIRGLLDEVDSQDDGSFKFEENSQPDRIKMTAALRFALFGGRPGPDTGTTLYLLGRERSLKRFERVQAWKKELDSRPLSESGETGTE